VPLAGRGGSNPPSDTDRPGGGIINRGTGTLTLNGSSSVTNNLADYDDDDFGSGGGIYCATTTAPSGDRYPSGVVNNYLGSSGTTSDNIFGCSTSI
jgi:hypothetical protein